MPQDFKHIIVLTGAGISAESGISVFRQDNGLWENHRVEDVATYDGFMRNKDLVYNFYETLRKGCLTKEPNKAHYALKILHDYCKKNNIKFTLITQNVDNLHERAGTEAIHMHGSLFTHFCENCHTKVEANDENATNHVCPKCHENLLRPDIVWFYEVPYHMDEIYSALQSCDLFISIGTSGVVYPAADFCRVAKSNNALCLEFNLERSAVASHFDYGFYEKASISLPAFVDEFTHDKDLKAYLLDNAESI